MTELPAPPPGHVDTPDTGDRDFVRHLGQTGPRSAPAARLVERAPHGMPPPLPAHHQSVRTGDTIRMLSGTFSTEHRSPDGSGKFVHGSVVRVDDHYLDAPTARRWVRNRIAEPYPGGTPGDVVTDAERVADTADLDRQMERLQHLKDRAIARAEDIRKREEEAEREAVAQGYVPVVRHRDPEAPIGNDPYRVPADEDPLARYGLADFPLLALKNAGYTRPEHIDDATDEELLEIKGVGTATLERLRGRRPED